MSGCSVSEVLGYFPKPEFRKYQKETLEGIAEAFNSGYKYILLETPTGFGKSPVNVAFCRAMRSFYCTPQNILLDQLQRDFPDLLALVKGRKHYKCVVSEGSCDKNAPCQRDTEYTCEDKYERCPYWIAKIKAINSQTALTNFAYFVGEDLIPASFPYRLGDRELLIIDEGHNIDQHILNFTSVVISSRTLPYPVFQEVKAALLDLPQRLQQDQIDGLLKEITVLCLEYLKKFPEELEVSEEPAEEEDSDEKKTRDFLWKVKAYEDNLDADWIGQVEKRRYQKGVWVQVRIQPVYVKGFMDKYLWRRADRFIVSSATIFRHDFVSECGLSDHIDQICYTQVPSTFPLQNRMIVDASVGGLSWSKKEENLPKALEIVKRILAIEPAKGIIHAHSYGFAEAIRSGVPDPRLMFHTSTNRDEALNDFLEATPKSGKVLIAVAMTEGLDLKGDLATFQIMFKCPFPNYAEDLRVYRRLKELKHDKWYGIQTLKTVVQAYGRAVRSPTDVAKFYIIDDDINRVCKRWHGQLPQFFREAFDAREKFR